MESNGVTIDLDPVTLKQVQIMAKNEKRTLEDEAAFLLEKGISICEFIESSGKKKNKQAKPLG